MHSSVCVDRKMWRFHFITSFRAESNQPIALPQLAQLLPLPNPSLGGILLGGFKAAMDHKLMKKEGVTHIVNAAMGLDKMWPQWAAAEARNEEELGIEILRLPWLDANDQQLEVQGHDERDRATE